MSVAATSAIPSVAYPEIKGTASIFTVSREDVYE
jgi:hypothetical protein